MKTKPQTIVLLLLMLPTAPGCGRYLVATPNLLQMPGAQHAYSTCPEDCQKPDALVLYATDRSVEGRNGASPRYGYGRSSSLAFGLAKVGLDPSPSWNELIRESTRAKRKRDYTLTLANTQELGRLKPPVAQVAAGDDKSVITQTAAQEIAAQRNEFCELLRGRLAQTSHKDVFIFIHGYNNTFEDAVFRAAEVWHFMGRVGVPVAYSWPAGLGGLRGYAYDRESGEFTVTHLRRFIQTIAECPDVERIHLIAHSRGCDVTISALRELNLVHRAQDKNTQQALKLENLVLAAPDIAEDIFLQRFVSERLLKVARRTTIYSSRKDRAIELADLIFASKRRLGMLEEKDFSPKMKHALARLPNVQFIECRLSGLWIGHSYVFDHPAGLSDLILVLRDRRDPGPENGRPLSRPAEAIWELNDSYFATTTSK
ncbi:MAG: alpha/beta hydrolase [Planctomycetes bacterium]|jgi:esterase/lipase superfamily enzyme|nr:alpha/beta hydrolase [Planctomycetota bacterium]